jgi:hypothetical protein
MNWVQAPASAKLISVCVTLWPVTTPSMPAVERAWQRQSVWSQAANGLKARPHRFWQLRLSLTVAAAVLALAGTQLRTVSRPAAVVLAIAAAVAMATVALVRSQQDVQLVRGWTRARSVSEALKTEVYQFLTHTGEYGSPDAEAHLDAEVQRMEREAGDLLPYTLRYSPKVRPLPAIDDVDSYLEVRVLQSQLLQYYEPKARQLEQRLRAGKAVEVTLALAAAVLAALAVVSANVGAWAAVGTTAAGAVAAYLAVERYEFLLIEYTRTAGELRRLLERRTSADGRPLTGGELVAECEQVISVQNQAWMAKWGEENTAAAG